MRAHAVVLCIQDTTELDFNGQEIAGLGPLNYEARRGMYLHPTYAVTPEREPLGMLDAWMWAREERGADGVRPGQKESRRWVEGDNSLNVNGFLKCHGVGYRLVYNGMTLPSLMETFAARPAASIP